MGLTKSLFVNFEKLRLMQLSLSWKSFSGSTSTVAKTSWDPKRALKKCSGCLMLLQFGRSGIKSQIPNLSKATIPANCPKRFIKAAAVVVLYILQRAQFPRLLRCEP